MNVTPIPFKGPAIRALIEGRKLQHRVPLKLRGHKSFSEFGPSDTRGYDWHFRDAEMRWHDLRDAELLARLPYAVGDLLWVRETWQVVRGTLDYETGGDYDCFPWNEEIDGNPRDFLDRDARYGHAAHLYYAADGEGKNPGVFYPLTAITGKKVLRRPEITWQPSTRMPRWASRLTLEVTDVRVQRLQDITEEDAQAEGASPREFRTVIPVNGKPIGATRPYTIPPSYRGSFANLWDRISGERGFGWDSNPWVAALTFTVKKINVDALLNRRIENDHRSYA